MAYTSTIRKLSENLKIAYENTIFSHSGNVGDSREKVVINYLIKVMAHKYGFQSGEVFDEGDNNSGQIDVIMYDNLFSTVFTDGSNKIIAPTESTFGIISVKSKMGVRELDNAIAGIKKYNNLIRPTSGANTVQIMPDFNFSLGADFTISSDLLSHQQNINCIFAFNATVAIDTILKKVKKSNCVDLVVVPNKFCIIGRHRKDFGLNDAEGNKLEFVSINTDNSVSLFILFLQVYLSRNRLKARQVDNLILDIIKESNYTKTI